VISGWWMVFCNKFVYQQPATSHYQQATNIQFFVIARNSAEGGMTKQSRRLWDYLVTGGWWLVLNM